MFTKSTDHNPNYLASIVQLKNVRKHSGADRLQVASIYGNNVITGLDAKEDDLVVFFPIESAISNVFLSWSDSFEDKALNADATKKGYFNKHGRVRAISLRGEKSEGYVVPATELSAFCKDVLGKTVVITAAYVGVDFDVIFDHTICKKYVPVTNKVPNVHNKKTKGSVKKYESKLVEGQFKFHYDTQHLKRNMFKVSPDDFVVITNKLHGTSFVVSNVLIKKKLNFVHRFLKKFLPIIDTEYGLLYSSRCVIKNQNYLREGDSGGFYKEDVWKIVADRLYPVMKPGISVYGEAVGYTPSGGFIQKNYDYGCKPGELDFYVYRVTYTSPVGDVFEFSDLQVRDWCNKNGVKAMPLFYRGFAANMFPDCFIDEHWHENVLNKLIEVYLEKDCDICVNNVPSEGVVLRRDNVHDYDAFKLKSFKFLQKESEELDAGVVDMETAQSAENDDNWPIDENILPS